MQEYKQWILRTIEQTWNMFNKRFIALWDQNKDGPGEAYLADIYNNTEVMQLVQEKYMRNLFHDSLGFGAAKMIRWERMNANRIDFFVDFEYLADSFIFWFWYLIRRIVGVAHVEDFESIKDDKQRAVCERKALEFGKMLLKERRKFKCIGEVVSAIQQQSWDLSLFVCVLMIKNKKQNRCLNLKVSSLMIFLVGLVCHCQEWFHFLNKINTTYSSSLVSFFVSHHL